MIIHASTRRGALRAAGPPSAAFTLMELLIVIAIIAVLLTMLMGGVQLAWECAYDVQCKTNLNRLYQALYMGRDSVLPDPRYWVGFIETMGAEQALLCPSGDSCLPDPAEAMKKRLPTPISGDPMDDDAVLPPPDDQSLPEQNLALMDPPASVIVHSLENTVTIRAFREKEDFALSGSVQVNISSPGYFDSFAKMTGGSVGSGQRINCYFVHYDPGGNGPGVSSGSMTFPGDILGIICRDAQLDASDSALGYPGTKYATGKKSRGFESGQDIVTLSQDRRTVIINRFYTTSVAEQMRVIVECKKKDENTPYAGNTPSERGWGSDGGWELEPRFNVGGPTSYGMNGQATSAGLWSGQILLVEYRRALVDMDGQGLDDKLDDLLAPRHQGKANVLFGDGEVRDMLPADLLPISGSSGSNPWKAKTGR
ncbi:MAG: prepilin-type N-terminal cleavage/methylation domain-containing protein [Planctomycetes bacterium]|nr:prepilin-type N-terminal cleavage/methylation domain-containing protein [Planctomycetota bacterium]